MSLASPSYAVSQYKDIKMTATLSTHASPDQLRADAKELAQLLGIDSLVEELRQAKKAGRLDSTKYPDRRLLNAKMLCLWQIGLAAQEVRALVAQVNADIRKSSWSMDSLTNQTQQATNMMNNFNFLQGGTLITLKQSFRIAQVPTPIPAQTFAMTAGGVGTVLSAGSLVAPLFFRRPITPPPTTLAHILSDSYRPKDADRSALWKFFNSPIPGSSNPLTRRQILIKHWEEFLSLRTKNHDRIKKLIALPVRAEPMFERLSLVWERIMLLRDFKSHIEEFDYALYHLQQSIEEE